MSKKLDVMCFGITDLTAKLFVMLRNMPKPEAVSAEEYIDAARRLCEHNFIVPEGRLEVVTMHFALYSLGDEDNLFSKTISKHSLLGA